GEGHPVAVFTRHFVVVQAVELPLRVGSGAERRGIPVRTDALPRLLGEGEGLFGQGGLVPLGQRRIGASGRCVGFGHVFPRGRLLLLLLLLRRRPAHGGDAAASRTEDVILSESRVAPGQQRNT